VLLELAPHLLDDLLSSDSYGGDGPSAEDKNGHAAQQAANEYFWHSDIDNFERLACHHFHLVQVGGEEKEAGE